jgi:hypothetical protein
MRVHPLYEVDPVTQTCACRKGIDCDEKQRGKHPRLYGWHEKATTDEAQVREWWTMNPRAGVGIVTGSVSGVWVLDIDGDAAQEWYDEQVKQHGLVHTLGVKTARGAHLYWRYPEGVTIRNAQRMAPGVDVRGEGGYVCAPPTVHRSGHVYAWVTTDGFTREMAPAPSWLLELVKERPKPPPRVLSMPSTATPREVRALFRAAVECDVAVRERIGIAAGGTMRAGSGKAYIDDLTCPKCGHRDAWFYLDDGPAHCHHKNSCGWKGPITSLHLVGA